MLKINSKGTKLRHWRRSGVFNVNFEYISCLVLVFLLLTLSRYMPTVNVLIPCNRRTIEC